MIKAEYKYSDITAIIIGCAMKVHNTLGMGFPEVIYQRALQIELNKTELLAEREVEHSVFYEGVLVGKRRVDFLINKLIPTEIKAIGTLDSSTINQILNYLEAFNLEIGLLINFGNIRLEYRRLTNNKYKPPTQ
jgi:GxxExxY protein